jgi:hypothetical protein
MIISTQNINRDHRKKITSGLYCHVTFLVITGNITNTPMFRGGNYTGRKMIFKFKAIFRDCAPWTCIQIPEQIFEKHQHAFFTDYQNSDEILETTIDQFVKQQGNNVSG